MPALHVGSAVGVVGCAESTIKVIRCRFSGWIRGLLEMLVHGFRGADSGVFGRGCRRELGFMLFPCVFTEAERCWQKSSLMLIERYRQAGFAFRGRRAGID